MLITVGSYSNPIEAHIVRGRLEAEGIFAVVAHENHSWAQWTITLAIGGVKVQVSSEDLEKSLNIIKGLNDGDYSLDVEEENDWLSLCPQCGSTEKERVNIPWKLSLILIFMASIPFPYTIYKSKCRNCSHVWKQKELKNYPIWLPIAAIVIIPGLYWSLNEIFFYFCKLYSLSPQCI